MKLRHYLSHAVLFLLLISGEALKWAKLSLGEQNAVSDVQVALTTGVVVAVALYGFCKLGFMQQFLKVSLIHLSAKHNLLRCGCTPPFCMLLLT